MTESNEPWKGDPEQRKRATRFGLIIAGIFITVVFISSLSRFLGW